MQAFGLVLLALVGLGIVLTGLPAAVVLIGVASFGALVGGDDVVAQARQVFANLEAALAAGGCSLADVAKVTVFLTDVDDRAAVNAVREERFGATRPASTLVEVPRLAVPGALIEIECVAQVPA